MYIEQVKKQIPYSLQGIPEGRAGVKKTLDVMANLVNQSKKTPYIREFARRHVQDLNQKDIYGEVKRLFHFVRDKVRYIKDIRGIETLHTPEKILEQMAGDCDDKSVLIASLLESIGYECRFVAVGFKFNNLSHVFTQVKLRGKWITLETTEPWPMGKTAPGIKETMIRII
jgi:transglutaminase-like putative cysteine protease